MTLTEFLTARIEEGRASAAATLEANARSRGGGLSSTLWDEEDAQASRVLREVEAKRAILAEWQAAEAARLPFEPEYAYGIRDGRADALLLVVKHCAAVWGDHPDYDETWR